MWATGHSYTTCGLEHIFLCFIKFFIIWIIFQSAPLTGIQGCDKSPLKGFKTSGSSPLCHVISNEKGQFTFPSIPPGSYKVVPRYEGPQSIKFDVKPVEIDFTVEHESLKIDTEFEVSTHVFIFIIFILFNPLLRVDSCGNQNNFTVTSVVELKIILKHWE
jgi:hypothetical protein